MIYCCCSGQGASNGGKATTVRQEGTMAVVAEVLVGALGDFGAVVPAFGGGQGRASMHLMRGSIRGCILPL